MSENELLHQYVKHGDDSALSQLYELVRPRLQAYAYRLLNDEHKAQDIVNETFLRLRQQREQREKALASGQPTTTSWLFAVARNSAIDELREIGLHKMDSYEGMIDSGNDPETQRESKAANPFAHPHDSSHLGSQPAPSVEEILKVIGETEEMTDDEIENLRKLIQPHLWKPVRGKTAEGRPKKDKFDYPAFAKEEGISEAAAYQRMSRLQTKRIPDVIRRVGGLAAFRALALRAVAWVRLLTNKQNRRKLLLWTFIIIALLISVVLIQTSTSFKTSATGASGNKTLGQTIVPAVNRDQPTTENNLADQSTVPNIIAAVPTANHTLVNTNLRKLKFRVLLFLDNIAPPTVEFSLNVEDNQQLRDLLRWFDGNEIVRIWYGDDIHLSVPVHFGDYKLEVSSVKTLTRLPRGSGENLRLLPDSSTNFHYVAQMYPTRDNVHPDVPYKTEITNMAKIALYAVEHVIPGKLDRFELILTNDFRSVYFNDLGGLSTNFIVPAEHPAK